VDCYEETCAETIKTENCASVGFLGFMRFERERLLVIEEKNMNI
jgi:hypothetical protein